MMKKKTLFNRLSSLGFQLDKREDPLLTKNVQHLIDICEQISQSTLFLLVERDTTVASSMTNDRSSEDTRTSELIEPLKIEYRRLGTKIREKWSHLFPFKGNSELTEEIELKEEQMYWDELPSKYRPMEVKFRKSDVTTVRVNLFPCPEKYISKEYRFISYGFHEDFTYLFIRHENKDILFAGLVERTPELNAPLMVGERLLEKYFINVLHHCEWMF